MRKFIFIIFLTLIQQNVNASQEKLEVVNSGFNLTDNMSVNSTLYTDVLGAPLTWFNSLYIASVENEVTFGIDPTIYQTDPAYQYKIVFDIEYDKLVGTALNPVTETGVELELNYDPLSAYQDKEVYSFTGGMNVKVLNVQLLKWNGSSYVNTSVDRDNLFFKVSVESNYYYNFNHASTPSDALTLSLSGSEYVVTIPYMQGAEQYDLEWTWVNAYAGTDNLGIPDVLPESAVEYNFRENATRVRISSNQYRIPNIYGDGYILFRYRGVGYVMVDVSRPVEGKWMTDGTSYGANNSVDQFPGQCKTLVNAMDNNSFNYNAGIVFANEGRKGVDVSFLDATLRKRQSQLKAGSQDELFIGSTIYDYYGRPAIEVMRSPVKESGLGYVEELNMFNSTDVYDKSKFHSDAFLLGDCGPDAAPPMDPLTSKGSANYYSNENTNKEGAEAYVPDAQGYNFLQVHYANEPTGRVKRVGGVGPDHQLDSDGHYTEVIHDIPGEDEVDELLGSEAASWQNYTKVITKDVHGQIGVSILDGYGRTVISYLEGSAPAGLDYIDGNGPLTAINVNLEPLTSQEASLLDQGILMVDKKIAVTDPNQVYTFNYDFQSLSYTDCLPPDICFDCIYEIEFTVTPAEGQFTVDCPLTDGSSVIPSSWSYTVGSITNFDINCDDPIQFSAVHPGTFTLQFPRFGEYYVKKVLKVSQAPIEYYWDEYVANADGACLIPYDNFLANAMSNIDFSQCYDGSACLMNFLFEYGSWQQYSEFTGETDIAVYNALQDSFVEDCENQPLCEQLLPILLADLQPGGQYGDVSGTDPLSVFNTSGSLSKNWKSPGVTFYDPNGNPSMTTNTSGQLVSVNHSSISLSEFLGIWEIQWAESLLEAHPEYVTYSFCAEYPEVFEYGTQFKLTDTWADAAANGFLVPVDDGMYNDCFNSPPVPYNSSLADPLEYLLNVQLTSLLSSPSYIYDDVYVPGINNYFDAAEYMLSTCNGNTVYEMASALSDGAPFGSSTCDLDAQWEAFKDIYLARRNMVLQVIMEGWAMNFSPCIRCIDYTHTICSGFSCTDYNSKIKRFPLFDQLMPVPFIEMSNNPSVLTSTANTNAADFCNGACESMADSWMISLQGCMTPMGASNWDLTDPIYTGLRADLIAVCQGGCSSQWPLPSQYYPGGSPYESFEEVITDYLDMNGQLPSIDCNHYLIQTPPPVQNQSIVPVLSSCGCDQLLSVHDEQEFEVEFGFIPVNFCADRETCASVAGLNPSGIYPLGSISWTPTQLANLELESTVTNYPCAAPCIDCSQLADAISSFLTTFPTASVSDNPVMFTSFVNEMFGTGFDYYSLTTFMTNCDSLNSGGIITSGFTQEATDLLNLLNALIPHDLLTLTTFGMTSPAPYNFFPPYFESVFYECATTGYYGYLPFYQSGSGMLQFSVNPSEGTGIPGPCNHCPKEQDFIYLMPESLAGWTNATEIYDNLISFTGIYVTALDLTSGPPPSYVSFHLTALVYNPNTGVNEEVHFAGRTQCFTVFDGDKLCGNIVPDYSDDCMNGLISTAELEAEAEYAQYLATQKEIFIADYIETCRQVDEDYSYDYQANKYHYTLMYYDRAGNLVKTVSPKGVVHLTPTEIAEVQLFRETDGVSGVEHIPAHTFATNYYYNALNQLLESVTPDGGSTKHWYDNIGRPVVSQNERQKDLTGNIINQNPYGFGLAAPAYTYILYDELGRPVETGEFIQPTLLTETIAKDSSLLSNWINQISSGTDGRLRHNVVRIWYSSPFSILAETEFGSAGHGDSRNRITAMTINEGYVIMNSGWSYPDPDYSNHYSYGVHGNVSSFLQENKALISDSRQFMHTDYQYDSWSGLPVRVDFQKGKTDQFSHHFKYDADYRLKEVWTSRDGYLWDRDANYEYRLDGYHARTELGDLNVQGSDFSYTLHGWLKSMNSAVLNPGTEMGKDGASVGVDYISTAPDLHATTGRDAFSYVIGYYHGDYQPIDTNPFKNYFATTTGTAYGTDINPLYTGNITSVITALMDLNEDPIDVTGTTYRYDQLHRFKESHVFTANDITSLYSFVNAARQNTATGITLGYNLGDWEAHVDYDPNGNVTNIDRRAYDQSPVTNRMDEFTYHYPATNNKLDYVDDDISGVAYGDIEDGQTALNYKYHDDGSLKADVSEEIGYIDWYPNGKIKRIYRAIGSAKPDVYFEYGPTGERILKVEMMRDVSGNIKPDSDWNYTYYALDYNGMCMAIYEKSEMQNDLVKTESVVYGRQRLGMDMREITIVSEPNDPFHQRILGEKRFELNDYLGNVKGLITDRKIVEEMVSVPGAFNFYPDVISYTDYYPYGMIMPGRNGSDGPMDYRFAFNGMEQDMEVSDAGNSYTTMFRQYDPRLGRWKSLDPLAPKYPEVNPFNAFNNNPIYFVDPLGLEGTDPDGNPDNGGEEGRPTSHVKWNPKNENGESELDRDGSSGSKYFAPVVITPKNMNTSAKDDPMEENDLRSVRSSEGGWWIKAWNPHVKEFRWYRRDNDLWDGIPIDYNVNTDEYYKKYRYTIDDLDRRYSHKKEKSIWYDSMCRYEGRGNATPITPENYDRHFGSYMGAWLKFGLAIELWGDMDSWHGAAGAMPMFNGRKHSSGKLYDPGTTSKSGTTDANGTSKSTNQESATHQKVTKVITEYIVVRGRGNVQVHTGKRGGKYYETKGGNKKYITGDRKNDIKVSETFIFE